MQSMVNSEDLPSIVHCLGSIMIPVLDRPLQLFVAECIPTGTWPQDGLWLTTVAPLRAVGTFCFLRWSNVERVLCFPPRKG